MKYTLPRPARQSRDRSAWRSVFCHRRQGCSKFRFGCTPLFVVWALCHLVRVSVARVGRTKVFALPRPLSSKTVIVVPCFNEAARLNCAAFENALKVDPMLEFIFVNDGSTDNTIDVLNQLERQVGDRARVLELERNSGKAEAVRAGVLRAFEQDAKYIGYWDADLATPLTSIELFAKELEVREVSLVLGSRVRLMG